MVFINLNVLLALLELISLQVKNVLVNNYPLENFIIILLDCTSGCLNCTSKSECQKCASGYILSDTKCERQEISGEGTTQGNNPIILYASTSVGLALGICGLTGIIINCFNSPNM